MPKRLKPFGYLSETGEKALKLAITQSLFFA